MGFYALALITISFYLKKVIGQAAWRGLHYTAFGTFVVALLHGVMAGTDRNHPLVFSTYIATGAIVALLIAIRFISATTPDRKIRTPAPRSTPKASDRPVRQSAD